MKFSKKTSKRKPGIRWVELDSTRKTDSFKDVVKVTGWETL